MLALSYCYPGQPRRISVRRFDQRQGFVVSALIHLTLLMILIAHPPTPRKLTPMDEGTPRA